MVFVSYTCYIRRRRNYSRRNGVGRQFVRSTNVVSVASFYTSFTTEAHYICTRTALAVFSHSRAECTATLSEHSLWDHTFQYLLSQHLLLSIKSIQESKEYIKQPVNRNIGAIKNRSQNHYLHNKIRKESAKRVKQFLVVP